jgi:hypothetical protein
MRDDLFRKSKNSASAKRVEFKLTKAEFSAFSERPCKYCGAFDQPDGLNGVERIDPNVPFIIENTATTCSLCKSIKSDSPEPIFLQRVEHIMAYCLYSRQPFPELFPDHCGVTWTGLLKRIKKDKTNPTTPPPITETEFDALHAAEGCYFCGKRDSKTHRNGLEFIATNKPTTNTIDHLHLCCANCANMKRGFDDASDFLNKLRDIFFLLGVNEIYD